MAAVLWMFLILYPVLAHSESGYDGDESSGETESSVTCESTIDVETSLICHLADVDLDVENATLCEVLIPTECSNATLEQGRFSFQKLKILTSYELSVYFQGGHIEKKDIDLRKIVKIPTPQIENATYIDDGALINFICLHDQILNPEFEVEIWANGNKTLYQTVKTLSIKVEGHMISDSRIYNVRVRARPTGNFSGEWTKWSAVKKLKKFKVYNTKHNESSSEEESSVACESTLDRNTSLSCQLIKDGLDVENATLCKESIPTECSKVKFSKEKFSFEGLSILSNYQLIVYYKGGHTEKKRIDLKSIVRIPIPEIGNATYVDDGVLINFIYEQLYVDEPEFQLEIWAEGTKMLRQNLKTKSIKIEEHVLRESEMYYVHVRAKPVDYFNGQWTEWSAVKNFSMNNKEQKDADTYKAPLFILCIFPIIVFLAILGILHWRKEIQSCLFPAIPHPKNTVAQICKEKHSPVSFSPDTFKDTNINPVVYEEKPLGQEFSEDCTESKESCYKYVMDGNEKVESEMSHLKIKLLIDPPSSEEAENNVGHQRVAVPQGYVKDETYVTMSSLYKAQ